MRRIQRPQRVPGAKLRPAEAIVALLSIFNALALLYVIATFPHYAVTIYQEPGGTVYPVPSATPSPVPTNERTGKPIYPTAILSGSREHSFHPRKTPRGY